LRGCPVIAVDSGRRQSSAASEDAEDRMICLHLTHQAETARLNRFAQLRRRDRSKQPIEFARIGVLTGRDNQSATSFNKPFQWASESFAYRRIVHDHHPRRVKLGWIQAAGAFHRQRVLIVFAGGESLLEKEALAAAARGCVDCQDAALILALDFEGVLVVEREVIAGDFNRRAIRTLRHIEAAELYIQRSARAYSERLSFDRK